MKVKIGNIIFFPCHSVFEHLLEQEVRQEFTFAGLCKLTQRMKGRANFHR